MGSVQSENTFYMHSDHLATPRLMTNQNQTIVWRWDGDAFGQGGINNDPDGDGIEVNSPLRFPGQIVEEGSGLYYNYFRDYDSRTGRYIQSDPVGVHLDFSAPQLKTSIVNLGNELEKDAGMSLYDRLLLNHSYGYVNQSPLSFSDIFGLAPSLTCEQKLRACRASTARNPILSGADRIKCEELYGALSNCTDEEDPDQNDDEEPCNNE